MEGTKGHGEQLRLGTVAGKYRPLVNMATSTEVRNLRTEAVRERNWSWAGYGRVSASNGSPGEDSGEGVAPTFCRSITTADQHPQQQLRSGAGLANRLHVLGMAVTEVPLPSPLGPEDSGSQQPDAEKYVLLDFPFALILL